jgi:CRP-like cAMP-binding protein
MFTQDILFLQQSLGGFSGMTEEDFSKSEGLWQSKLYKKGDAYNSIRQVCKFLGIVESGVFRTYNIDEKSGEEKNLFFYSQNQLVVSFASFINQVPCHYYTEAMTDAKVIYIHHDDLMKLYRTSHAWEHFGRILAEQASNIAFDRTESLLFQSAETRYLNFLNQHPNLTKDIPLYHISSYLGIQGPSLSRIRKKLMSK